MSNPSKDKQELTREQLEKVAGGEHNKRGDGPTYPRRYPSSHSSSSNTGSSSSHSTLLK